MRSHKHTLHLLGILCNRARSPDGDHISLCVEGRELWSNSADRQFHPYWVYYINFEYRLVHMIGHIESLPDVSPEDFCITVKSFPISVQLEITALPKGDPITGQIVIESSDYSTKGLYGEIIGHGADYRILYRLERH